MWRVLLLVLGVFLLSACADSGAYRRKHGGYDSQTWTPKKRHDVNFRTYTGYPRRR
ncbi:MAG: hypothetical protein SFU27_14335 [Thermonemataceae bacterium]|nr:hypothetical protein [Thermonemataceae bacterium]